MWLKDAGFLRLLIVLLDMNCIDKAPFRPIASPVVGSMVIGILSVMISINYTSEQYTLIEVLLHGTI